MTVNDCVVADRDICFDLQHGLIDYSDVVPGLQALRRSACMPLARVPWNEPGIIGKVLDAGVMGVIIPMVNTPEEASQAVAACRYAPLGARSPLPIRETRPLRTSRSVFSRMPSGPLVQIVAFWTSTASGCSGVAFFHDEMSRGVAAPAGRLSSSSNAIAIVCLIGLPPAC